MKKLFYILTMLPILAVSCSEREPYKPAEPETGAQVYFCNDNNTDYSLSSLENTFNVKIGRVDAAEAISVPIKATGDGTKFFTVPSTVKFAAGQEIAELAISYNPDELGFDNKQTLTLSIGDEALTTQYGLKDWSLTAVMPSPWTLLGKCTINENWWFEDVFTCNIYQNDLNPNVFRLESPFGQGDKPTITLLQPGDVYKNVTITKEGLVGYDDIDVALHSSYNDEIFMVFPGRFTKYGTEDSWSFNKVLSYQENGLPAVIQLAPYHYMYNTGGWDHSQADDYCTIVFPGVVLKDYSLEVAYAGKYTDAEGNEGVMVSFPSKGADVESVKTAVVPGMEVDEETLEKILAGDYASSETEFVPFEGTPTDGKYTIVAISYGDGEAQEMATATFNYVAGGEAKLTWKAIATGDYTYNGFYEGTDEGLVLYQAEENERKFKISPWGNEKELYFTMMPNGAIIIDEMQEIGDTYDKYGAVYVTDQFGYAYDPADVPDYVTPGTSSYDGDKTFTFAVMYEISLGYLCGSVETFVITDDAPSEKATASAVKAVASKTIQSRDEIHKKVVEPVKTDIR